MDAAFEVFRDQFGKFRWRLRARNSAVIATSPHEGYATRDHCAASIKLVRILAGAAEAEDLSQTWPSASC